MESVIYSKGVIVDVITSRPKKTSGIFRDDRYLIRSRPGKSPNIRAKLNIVYLIAKKRRSVISQTVTKSLHCDN